MMDFSRNLNYLILIFGFFFGHGQVDQDSELFITLKEQDSLFF